MRIGIDAREISRPSTGTGMYVLNLIKSLARFEIESDFFLVVEGGSRLDFDLPLNFKYIDIRLKIFDKVQDQLVIPIVLAKYKLDVYHVTHHDVTPFLSRIPLIVTVLDLAWIDCPGESGVLFKKYYYLISKIATKKAKSIITISESTKKRVVKHFPLVKSKVKSILIACDPGFGILKDEEQFHKLTIEFGLCKPYVLYVGSFAMRKNLSVLIDAMKKIWLDYPNIQLVLAGNLSGKNDENIIRLVDTNSIVLISRRKSIQELNSLYENALVFVFPSIYEGFGLPVLEAMSTGCPVIASNSTSIPEILGDKQITFNPNDSLELQFQLKRVIQDKNLINDMRISGLKRSKLFNWNTVADQTLQIYFNN